MPPKKLRSGFTTGTAAAAAVKAALQALLQPKPPHSVRIDFLSEGRADIPVYRVERLSDHVARASVIKDAGDDPDVTHKAEIGATVSLLPAARPPENGVWIVIRGGRGVGRVTKPGLEVAPGEPAINPGPRRMIRRAVRQVMGPDVPRMIVDVEIFVPKGEELARQTLNARLGIVGGLSILGTTGIVKPLSHEAYTATIRAALGVARATGRDRVAMTTGRRSERHLQAHLSAWREEQFVQIGDYFQFALGAAGAMGFAQVVMAVFFGKAVKMAMGVPHTHAARASLMLDRLSDWTAALTGEAALAARIRGANTARHAFDLLGADHPAVIARVGQGIVRHATAFAGQRLAVRCLIFDYQGQIIFDSESESLQAPQAPETSGA
jgi:cobalt-precorrin-5B (C1)-methyltransferase